jgi:hypothetical protein
MAFLTVGSDDGSGVELCYEDRGAGMLGGTVGDRAEQMAALGIPMDIATSIAAVQGTEMGRSILSLYRSARQPAMAEAGRALENAAARPGLSLLATEDPYIGSDELRRRAADRAGAPTEVLDELGHRWMVQDPARGAAALTRFGNAWLGDRTRELLAIDRPQNAAPGVGGMERVAVRRQIRLGWIVRFTCTDGEFDGRD